MSAAPKFTPGPWKLDTVPISNGSGSCHRIGEFPGTDWCSHTYACLYVDGIRIGIDEGLPRAIELAANARLMAAAPRLYAALARVTRQLSNEHPTDEAWLEAEAALASVEAA